MIEEQTPAESLWYVMEMLQILRDQEMDLKISLQDQGTYDPEWCYLVAEEFDITVPEVYSKLLDFLE
jgi:hypothetical protein